MPLTDCVIYMEVLPRNYSFRAKLIFQDAWNVNLISFQHFNFNEIYRDFCIYFKLSWLSIPKTYKLLFRGIKH